MEIRIDTSKDNLEDIKKVIKFLQHFIDETPDYSGPIEISEGTFNIFDNPDNNEEILDPELPLPSTELNDDVKIVSYD